MGHSTSTTLAGLKGSPVNLHMVARITLVTGHQVPQGYQYISIFPRALGPPVACRCPMYFHSTAYILVFGPENTIPASWKQPIFLKPGWVPLLSTQLPPISKYRLDSFIAKVIQGLFSKPLANYAQDKYPL